MRDEGEDPRRVGRDEMNLCEFPIASLADRVSPGCKTMVFEDYRHSAVGFTVKWRWVWAPTTVKWRWVLP